MTGDGGQPTLSEVISSHVDSTMENLHTAIPGRVVSYDGHSKRTATIKPSIRLPTSTGVYLDIPPIPEVPVVFPSCAAGSVLFNLQPGDGVLLVTSEVGIGKFLSSKDPDTVDPDDSSRFTLTDVVAIPGLRSSPSMPAAPSADGDILVYSNSGALVSLGNTILVKNSESDLKKEIQNLWSFISELVANLGTQFTTLAADAANISSDMGVQLGKDFGIYGTAHTNEKTAADTAKNGVGKLLT